MLAETHKSGFGQGTHGLRTASYYYEETQGEDSGYSEFLLQFHLQARHHCDGQAHDDYIRKDVE